MTTLNDNLVNLLLSDVELCYLETLSISRKINLVLLYKDHRQKSVDGLDKIQLEDIKKQLSAKNIQFAEGRPLNWSQIMEEVREDPQQFTEAGGWDGLDLGMTTDLVVKMEPVLSLSCSSCEEKVRLIVTSSALYYNITYYIDSTCSCSGFCGSRRH